jgi:NADH dehydrogenase
MKQRILVMGGTGFVGRAVLERLVERNGGGGGLLRVPTRRLGHARDVQSLPTVEVVQADVHDEAQLTRLLAGVDAVIQLVASLHGSEASFRRVHVELLQKLVRACQAQGVRRVVQVSALGLPAGAGAAAQTPPSNYLRSKLEGEAVLKAAQATAGLQLTLLRPSVIFGAEDRFLNTFAQLQAVAPVMPLAGGGARFQPVWVEDVASAVVRCLDQPDTIGQTYELAGPEVYTLSRLVQLSGLWSGNERPQIPLPASVGKLQALMMELLPGEPLMSRDNVDSMKVPNVASGQLPGLQALGITPTALEAVAPGYLSAAQGRGKLNRLRARARRA